MPKPENKDLNRMVKRGVVRVFFEVYKDLHFDLDEPAPLKKVVHDAISDAGYGPGLVEMPGLRSNENITAVMVEDPQDRDAYLYFEEDNLDSLITEALLGS